MCLQPKEETIGNHTVSTEAAETFQDIVTFPNHPLVEANMTFWDYELARIAPKYGIQKLNFKQEDVAGNKTLENIINTWVAFGVDSSNTSITVACHCVTVDPPTLSKPGISNQVNKKINKRFQTIYK